MEQRIVDGLRNLGNTCYFNTVVQALASCASVLHQLEAALQQLDAASNGCMTGPAPAGTGGAAEAAPLAAALLSVLRQLQPHAAPSQTVAPRQLVDAFRSKLPAGVLEAGEEHDASEAVEELCRLVAEELHSGFARRLQPQLTARAAVAALLQQPDGTAPLQLEGDSAGGSSKAPPASGKAASACNGHAEPESREEEATVHAGAVHAAELRTAAPAAVAAAGAADAAEAGAAAAAPGSVAAAAGAEAADVASTAAQDRCLPDAVLQGWQRHAQLPLHGSSAHELQCLRCRHRSVVQLSPFWVLSLPIPTDRGATLLGNVPAAPGASLEACLASAFCYEALHGWHCTRCSLAASLKAAQAGAGGRAGPGTPAAAEAAAPAAPAAAAAAQDSRAAEQAGGDSGQQQQQQQDEEAGSGSDGLPLALQQLHQGLVAGGRLAESEAYRCMLARAGLAWLPRPSPAAKRTIAARLPRVLCLQLQRGFWSEHGHVKVAGHVAFPLLLALPPELVPRLGHEPAPQPTSHAKLGALLHLQRRAAPRYILRAVLVHHGPLAGAGHYTVFRSLGAAPGSSSSSSSGAEQGTPCAGGSGPIGSSSSSGGGGSGAVHRSWVWASDESVHPAELREVLEAEASMLVYEACS